MSFEIAVNFHQTSHTRKLQSGIYSDPQEARANKNGELEYCPFQDRA
jgi:hypothetical protein